MALGDHQVAPLTVDIAARTIGARIHVPSVDPGRSTDVQPFFGIRPIRRYPFYGSGVFIFDAGPFTAANPQGTPPPPMENLPAEGGPGPARVPTPDPGRRAT